MEKEKKSYYINVIEAKDGKMCEVMNFNFGGHHDLAAIVERVKASGVVSEDKYAKQLVLGLRLLHHAIKKNPNSEIFQAFAPQLKAFKDALKEKSGCGCDCGCK